MYDIYYIKLNKFPHIILAFFIWMDFTLQKFILWKNIIY